MNAQDRLSSSSMNLFVLSLLRTTIESTSAIERETNDSELADI